MVDVEQHRTLTESGAAAEQCATGVPTADVFDLRALKPGQASIGFVYEKPFNKIEPPAKRLLVKVDVD